MSLSSSCSYPPLRHDRKSAGALVIRQQRPPWRIEFQHPCWCGFFVEQLRLAGGAATRAKRLNPDCAGNDSVGDDDNIADPDQVSGLPDDDPVEDDSSGRAKARGERPAFGEAREPQPLIETPARRSGRIASAQVSFNSRNLANGCPSANADRWRLLIISRRPRRGPLNFSSPARITAR